MVENISLKFRNWVYIMEYLFNKNSKVNILKLSHDIKMAYPQTSIIIKELEKRELIIVEKHGRENRLNITLKGRKVAEYLMAIKNLIGDKNGE